jgi:hypothetical protein
MKMEKRRCDWEKQWNREVKKCTETTRYADICFDTNILPHP